MEAGGGAWRLVEGCRSLLWLEACRGESRRVEAILGFGGESRRFKVNRGLFAVWLIVLRGIEAS